MTRTRFMRRFVPILAAVAVAAGCWRDDAPTPVSIEASSAFGDDADDVEIFHGWLDEVFAKVQSHDFSRVDRMGMPAIATAVITSKDAYNQAGPLNDADGDFVGEITSNVDALHQALDDDLTGLGLTPCATADCVGQAAPFVVPDVITIDTSQPAGFPNGRRLTDPVIDVTLALVLLDLNSHAVTTLVGVNPTANDKRFKRNFPFLAKPHKAGDDDDDDDSDRDRDDDDRDDDDRDDDDDD